MIFLILRNNQMKSDKKFEELQNHIDNRFNYLIKLIQSKYAKI